MPVFLCRVGVALNVTNHFAIHLASGVETERGFNPVVLQVAVDSLRATDYLNASTLSLVVFSEHASVGVRVVATDNHDSTDIQFLDDFQTLFELVNGFKFGTARTDDVETASVAILVDNIASELHIVVINKSTRSHEEAIQAVSLVQRLKTVEQTTNYIVSARSLTTRKDNAHVDHFLVGTLNFCHICVFFKTQFRQSVSVRE